MITVGKSVQIASEIRDLQDQVQQLMAEKVVQGFNFGGHNFQIDPASTSIMTAMFVLLISGVPSPHGGTWRATNNVSVPMDDAAVKIFILAAKGYLQSLLSACWVLKDAAGQLTTLASISTFNFQNGWPFNS